LIDRPVWSNCQLVSDLQYAGAYHWSSHRRRCWPSSFTAQQRVRHSRVPLDQVHVVGWWTVGERWCLKSVICIVLSGIFFRTAQLFTFRFATGLVLTC